MIDRLSAEQNHRCAYCGFTMLEKRPSASELRKLPWAARKAQQQLVATKDHVIPKCDGGSGRWDNLVAACAFCNGYRANQPAEIAFQRIQRLVRRGTHPHQIFDATGCWNGGGRLQTIHRQPSQQGNGLWL
ncbi:HNH endonuclease [Bosea massiliensis]|uniref:HNH endonuclease n=1 Tax=Bosea massiliensis TaxID=151419 RepID=A0ABW0PAW3_9HYPH